MKSFSLSLRIAWVHLMAKKRQTLVAMLGVTFGISMFIVMISFMSGVNDYLMDLALDGSPHVHIYNPVKIERPAIASSVYDTSKTWIKVHHQRPKLEQTKIRNGQKIVDEIKLIPEVSKVSPSLSSQVFFNNGPLQFSGTMLGIDVETENEMYKLYEKIETGSIEKMLSNRDGILLGENLAKKLNVNVGDRVNLSAPTGGSFMLKVVGTFSFGMTLIDETRCYVSIQTAQKILGKPANYFTDINIKLKDYNKSQQLTKQFETMFGYKAEDWQQANASILAGEVIRNTLTYVVAITMLVVAGFGIYNIMNMTVVNKMRDIAILKATGFESKDIISIFLFQSIIIGISGAIIGVILGAAISFGIDQIPFPARELIKLETFPVAYNIKHYGMAIFFGFLTTLFAGYFPSKKASKIDPVAIIRG
jgi:lipoprotein-releasing system permease protein